MEFYKKKTQQRTPENRLTDYSRTYVQIFKQLEVVQELLNNKNAH